jgi:DNA polymerase-3 subunit alpha
MFDAHRHDEFSFFDGSGKAIELAQLAKEKGYTALGLTNHGNTSGLIQHYDACKAVGLKPVLGVEAYFLPVYKENKRGFHLCLYAKNLEGYKNINAIQSEGEKQKYYNPIITFEILEKYSEGVICSTACVAGFLAQCIINNKHLQAKKFLKRMLKIFGDDLYIEIQPYKVSEKGLQERVNVEAIKLAEEFGIKCIFTSDSHRGRKEDLESYIAMHMLKNKNPEYVNHIRNTYSARYMPNKDEMQKRFLKMHENDLGIAKCKRIIAEVERNMDEFEEKVEGDIIDQLASVYSLPKFDEEQNSYVLLKSKVKEGLKEKGIYKKNYIKRALEELKVIKSNNFEDYFLIVQDYVKYAKNKGIVVGVGRGSGCNCLINYALGITEVDPIIFGLDYKRFIREDKKQLPDIDVDFETDRRNEVIEYMVNKYKGHAVQIASYGMYKVDNLVNDVVKLYDEMEKEDIKNIKKLVNDHKDSEKMVDIEKLKSNSLAKKYNAKYNGIIDNFCFMYNKVKYIGTHAAGVAVSKLPIYYYTAVRYDKKSNKYFSSYNLVDLERIGIIKYDMLGLNTLNSLKDYAEKSGVKPDILDMIKDKKILNKFACGNSDGVFQFDSHAAQSILKQINVDSFKDVVAANAMDRPGPLSLGIPEKYAMAKETWVEKENKPVYSKYINDTYGCILYQEQVNSIAVEYGGLNWNQADKLRKMDDPGSFKARKLLEQYHDEFLNVFIRGMKKHGVGRSEASELFGKFLNYTFNKGHAVGYTLISFYEMFYKVYYNTIFWQVKLKYCSDENEWKFQNLAVKDGALILTPHVNGSAYYSIANVDNEDCILMGISSIKGVGDKVAKSIEEERKKNGNYKDIDDLCDRLPKRIITSRVKEALKENGACIFDKKRYFDHVMRYNIELASR